MEYKIATNRPSPQLVDSGQYWYYESLASNGLDPNDWDYLKIVVGTAINTNYKMKIFFNDFITDLVTNTAKIVMVESKQDIFIYDIKDDINTTLYNLTNRNTWISIVSSSEINPINDKDLGYIQLGHNAISKTSEHRFGFYFTSVKGIDLPANIYTYDLYAYRYVYEEITPYSETQNLVLSQPNIITEPSPFREPFSLKLT